MLPRSSIPGWRIRSRQLHDLQLCSDPTCLHKETVEIVPPIILFWNEKATSITFSFFRSRNACRCVYTMIQFNPFFVSSVLFCLCIFTVHGTPFVEFSMANFIACSASILDQLCVVIQDNPTRHAVVILQQNLGDVLFWATPSLPDQF